LWADVDQVFARVKSPYGAWSPEQLNRRVDDLSKLLQSNPRDAGLIEQRAGLNACLGRYDEAALDFICVHGLSVPQRWNATSALFNALMQHEEVFARVAELRPDDLDLWQKKGQYHDLRGQWKQALPAYARASADSMYAYALLLTGDEDGYREACQRLAGRFGDTNEPDRARRLVEVCSAGPQSGIDPAQMAEWMQLAINAHRNKFTLNALAWAHYRAGQFDQTLQVLQEAMELPEPMLTSQAAFPLSLAYRGLGQEEEGRKWYRIGVANLDRVTPRTPYDSVPWAHEHWIGVNVWYREAKAVFEPTDPQASNTEKPEQRTHHGDTENTKRGKR
jgi:tetratricopeptide (TPR) repeat protein